MAITPATMTAAGGKAASTYTMSLVQGWDLIPAGQGGRLPVAGDVVILAVRKPFPVLAGPPGWIQATSNVFYKTIGPREPDPVFTAEGTPDWEIEGYAVAAADLEPSGGDGSAVPWATPTA